MTADQRVAEPGVVSISLSLVFAVVVLFLSLFYWLLAASYSFGCGPSGGGSGLPGCLLDPLCTRLDDDAAVVFLMELTQRTQGIQLLS